MATAREGILKDIILKKPLIEPLLNVPLSGKGVINGTETTTINRELLILVNSCQII
jgi:hypothetical protein